MSSNPTRWSVVGSPIGDLVLLSTPTGIARIAWDVSDPEDFAGSEASRMGLGAATPGGSSILDLCQTQLEMWFAGKLLSFDLPLAPDPRAGQSFSSRVLALTAGIPRGETLTYGQVAQLAGSAAGARATGNALGGNPIPIVVPCHRVVAAAGLGGFGGGSERKRLLLALEGAAVPD